MITKILAKRREESYDALYQLTKKGDGTWHEKHCSDCKNSLLWLCSKFDNVALVNSLSCDHIFTAKPAVFFIKIVHLVFTLSCGSTWHSGQHHHLTWCKNTLDYNPLASVGFCPGTGFWLPQSKDMFASPIAENGWIYIKKGGSNQTCHSGGNPEEKLSKVNYDKNQSSWSCHFWVDLKMGQLL